MKKAAIVIAVIAGLMVSARPASAQVCIAGILFAAFYANATENRELSATEASTCGLMYGSGANRTAVAAQPASAGKAAAPKAKKPRKTAAAKAKQQ